MTILKTIISIMNTLKEIDDEIWRLTVLKEKLIEDQNNKEIYDVKDLSWTKKCRASLFIESFYIKGIPKYKISLYGPTPNLSALRSKSIEIFGDSLFYENNIVFNKKEIFMEENSYLSTNSYETLIKFLKTAQFESFEYDKSSLEVLKFLESNYK